MTIFERLNRRRLRDDVLHELATGLWLIGGAMGWAILIAEGLRLYAELGPQP
ncbi:hypothetical protein [Gemmobacter nectariphilus]|uniref:hypothetical protein n=1 Tax=Gemmobacter nectariphilus TaxID=220343 RepID=UPI000421677F|nr:hypothetical protein [Gemmobacter nectariphilus]